MTIVLRTCNIGSRESFGSAEPIPDTPDGLDLRRREARRGEFGAQARQMDVDGPRLHEPVASPDEVEQLVPPEHSPRAADQNGQQLELLEREIHAPALHGDLETVPVDLELARP